MNGIHDMGGMHGFGPISYEEDEPVFHHEWEGRIFALPGFTGRFTIERMDPALYLASSYYEKWLYSKIEGSIEQGFFTPQELEEKIAYFRDNPEANPPRREDPDAVQNMVASNKAPESNRRDVDIQPVFRIGDVVITRNYHPPGHTRLPQYARGKRGVVVAYYGVQDIADTMPPGVKAVPQPLYCVRIEGLELWGESAEANSAVYLDMWESYFEPA